MKVRHLSMLSMLDTFAVEIATNCHIVVRYTFTHPKNSSFPAFIGVIAAILRVRIRLPQASSAVSERHNASDRFRGDFPSARPSERGSPTVGTGVVFFQRDDVPADIVKKTAENGHSFQRTGPVVHRCYGVPAAGTGRSARAFDPPVEVGPGGLRGDASGGAAAS